MSLDSALELDENDEDIREKARDHQQNKGAVYEIFVELTSSA